MTLRRVVIPLLVAGLLVSCVNVSSRVTVRPDGSGTVTERMVLPAQVTMMMQSLQQLGDSAATSPALLTEEDVRDRSESMSGMRLESVTMLSDDRGEGYEAVYAFDNLNDVSYDPAPGDVLPDDTRQGREENPMDLLSAVDLSFEPGTPATLTVGMPRDDDPEIEDDTRPDDPPVDDPSSPREEKLIRQMLQDSGVRLVIDVEGDIIETNATHRSGSSITLIDVDFGEIMKDSTSFSRMMSNDFDVGSTAAAYDSLNTVPGITIEPQENVTIRFQ